MKKIICIVLLLMLSLPVYGETLTTDRWGREFNEEPSITIFGLSFFAESIQVKLTDTDGLSLLHVEQVPIDYGFFYYTFYIPKGVEMEKYALSFTFSYEDDFEMNRFAGFDKGFSTQRSMNQVQDTFENEIDSVTTTEEGVTTITTEIDANNLKTSPLEIFFIGEEGDYLEDMKMLNEALEDLN